MAVRFRLRNALRRDDTACARLVFDDERLAHPLAELLRDDSNRDVGRAANREGNDDDDRLGWIRLCARISGQQPADNDRKRDEKLH